MWFFRKNRWPLVTLLSFSAWQAVAQAPENPVLYKGTDIGMKLLVLVLLGLFLAYIIKIIISLSQVGGSLLKKISFRVDKNQISGLTADQIDIMLKIVPQTPGPVSAVKIILPAVILWIWPHFSNAQTTVQAATRENILTQPGVLITFVLLFIPLLAGFLLLISKISTLLKKYQQSKIQVELQSIADNLGNDLFDDEVSVLNDRKKALRFQLSQHELAGKNIASDEKGLLNNIKIQHGTDIFPVKKKPIPRPKIDPQLTQLILAFIASAVLWLVIGTTIGEYVGIKFVAPDADAISWLSFGRLRPVHTNLVFWGWATLGMLGLGYYVVPMVGNGKLASIKMGWASLHLINLSHVLGTVSLMAGINNGGGEYREYIWPIMLLFAIGLGLSTTNYLKTIAQRKTKEIYISNWYISAAVIFLPIIALVSYLPFWQNGIGEVILQGFYMHQAVGLWFMMFCLGLLYYFLPQQFNKPIYSYSLGVLAFWTQILFYTLIGTHHFVFSALPWWLQTTAIVGSVGMLIPVTSGTINFLMTFKGGWDKVTNSYSLPFFLVGVIYYFTGSYQGTAEAFRSTNLIWHFTDFTIAHSHITMYGIISFIIFAGIYAIVPRLTGKEPPQIMVGAHFWLALIGLQFYTIPLMIGGTLKGLSWGDARPFIESVILMGPYWLWRAIGGSMMWLSHLVLAYNLYKMVYPSEEFTVKEEVFKILKQKADLNTPLIKTDHEPI